MNAHLAAGTLNERSRALQTRRAALVVALLLAQTPFTAHAHGSHGVSSQGPSQIPIPAPSPEMAAAEAQLRALIKAHPELAAKIFAEQAQQSDAQRAELARSMRPAIESAQGGFALGPDSAKVTVVDFFDYHCGPCKRATQDVLALAAQHSDVRFVFKEMPVLSEESRVAARAALAARAQGRYVELHAALMSAPGVLTEPRILSIAAKAGLDVDRLRQDMNAAPLEQELETTLALSRTLGVKGTPVFYINGELLPGRDLQRLKKMIDQEARLAERK